MFSSLFIILFVIKIGSIVLSFVMLFFLKKRFKEKLEIFFIFIKKEKCNELFKKLELRKLNLLFTSALFIAWIGIIVCFSFILSWDLNIVSIIFFVLTIILNFLYFCFFIYTWNHLNKIKKEIILYWTLKNVDFNKFNDFFNVHLVVNKKDFFMNRLAKNHFNKKIIILKNNINNFEKMTLRKKAKFFYDNYYLINYFFSYFKYNKEKLNENKRNLFNISRPIVINFFGEMYVGNNADIDFVFDVVQSWYSEVFK